MTNPASESTDDRLTAYVLGELDEVARAEFEQLLASRPDLQQELKELEALAGMLHQELLAEPKPSLTAEQHQRVLQCAEAMTEPAPTSPPNALRRRRVRRWAIIGAEIAMGLAVTAGVIQYSGASRQPASVANRFQELKPAASAATAEGLVSAPIPQYKLLDAEGLVTGLATTSEAAPKGDLQSDSVHLFSASGTQLSDEPKDRFLKREASQSVANWSDAAPEPEATRRFFGDSLAAGERKPAERGVELRYKMPTNGIAGPSLASSYAVAPADPDASAEYRYRGESGRLTDESYAVVTENAFVAPSQQPLSTFSIDVDTASYSNVRRFLTQGQMPPADAVRIEELVNYFSYDYPQPKAGDPFSVTADAAPCPWQRDHYVARIALQARTIDKARRPPTNLVFLLDVSGSMQAANKLPLVKQAMTMLAEELNERDRIAIVTYAGDAGVKLASTPGSDQTKVMQSIEALQAGGSTNGAAGINLAYEEALRHFNGEGENRVILCTDGDFNVGVSDDEQLVQLIQQHAKSKVFLSIFGFGMGNLKDAKLEKLADKGNGHYGYIDDLREARRVFNEELVGTLYTVAKDVKIQVEFNPLTVGAYRLIGYENRALAAKDFNDDTKDAGEIGAGHTVTALYEIVPKGIWTKARAADSLKYTQTPGEAVPVEAPKTNLPPESADDLFTVKLRYKQPTADTSVKSVDYVVDDIAGKNIAPSADFRWSAVVAAFGMQLRNSSFKGQWTLDDVYEAGLGAKGTDSNGRRREFLDLVQSAKRLSATTHRNGQ